MKQVKLRNHTLHNFTLNIYSRNQFPIPSSRTQNQGYGKLTPKDKTIAKQTYSKAPIPKDEQERLETVRELKLLDTPPEERFDRITRLALSLFNVPISTITLIDSHREWYKLCQGLPVREGKRAISFCGHTIISDLLIIPDTKKDTRFALNPLVANKPYIRFYAGVSLKAANGKKIGAFCIKDYIPRKLNKEKISLLKSLGEWTELELNAYELSQALAARQAAEKKIMELNEILHLLNKILRHDLLNNLTIMKGNIELHLQGKRNGQLKTVYSVVDKSSFLIKKIGQLETTLSNGNSLKPYSLTAIISQVCKYFPSIKFELKGNGTILADQAFISVVENLINNAKVHGGAKEIRIAIEQKKDLVEICFADYGKGIPDTIKNKIFQEGFHYGKTGNIGLGLYIVKKTIERYGGKIDIKDNKPQGSIFIIKLPKIQKFAPLIDS